MKRILFSLFSLLLFCLALTEAATFRSTNGKKKNASVQSKSQNTDAQTFEKAFSRKIREFTKQFFLQNDEKYGIATNSAVLPTEGAQSSEESKATRTDGDSFDSDSQKDVETLLQNVLETRFKNIECIHLSHPIMLHPSLLNFLEQLYLRIRGTETLFSSSTQHHLIILLFSNVMRNTSKFSLVVIAILCCFFSELKVVCLQVLAVLFVPVSSREQASISFGLKDSKKLYKIQLSDSTTESATQFWGHFVQQFNYLLNFNLLRMPLLKEHVTEPEKLVPYFRDQEMFDIFCDLFLPFKDVSFPSLDKFVESIVLRFLTHQNTIAFMEESHFPFFTQSYRFLSIRTLKQYSASFGLLFLLQNCIFECVGYQNSIVFSTKYNISTLMSNTLAYIQIESVFKFYREFMLNISFNGIFGKIYPVVEYLAISEAMKMFQSQIKLQGNPDPSKFYREYCRHVFSYAERQNHPLVYLCKPASLAAQFEERQNISSRNRFFSEILSQESLIDGFHLQSMLASQNEKLIAKRKTLDSIINSITIMDFLPSKEKLVPLVPFDIGLDKIFADENYLKLCADMRKYSPRLTIAASNETRDQTLYDYYKIHFYFSEMLKDRKKFKDLIGTIHQILLQNKQCEQFYSKCKKDTVAAFSYFFHLVLCGREFSRKSFAKKNE